MLSLEQEKYLKKREQPSVNTLVSNSYNEVIKFIDDHYRQLAQRQLKRKSLFDCSTNYNPKSWIREVGRNDHIFQHCDYKDLNVDQLRKHTNNKIAIELINLDCSHTW